MNKYPLSFLMMIVAILALSLEVFAQPPMGSRSRTKLNYRGFMMQNNRLEAGFSAGVANAMTDIAASQANMQASMLDVYSRGLSPALGVYGRYRFNELFSMKLTGSALMIKGNDRWSSDIDVVNRGKSFTNNIYEAALMGEVYMPKRAMRPKRDFSFNRMDLFLFAGLAAFHHSPQVNGDYIDDFDENLMRNSQWIYGNWQMAFPLGLGWQWTLGNRYVMGLDFNFRYTFFDYLDGFRRPYSDRNDFYFTSTLSFGFILSSASQRTGRSTARHVFR